jgi:hypothetical protein
MLSHLSIPARDPATVAAALATLMGGETLPFVPLPGAFIAFASHPEGVTVEVYPADTRMLPGVADVQFAKSTPLEFTATHLAIETVLDQDGVLALAQEHTWLARVSPRGPFFSVIEVWIENFTLVEVMTPSMAESYRQIMTPAAWRQAFQLA